MGVKNQSTGLSNGSRGGGSSFRDANKALNMGVGKRKQSIEGQRGWITLLKRPGGTKEDLSKNFTSIRSTLCQFEMGGGGVGGD